MLVRSQFIITITIWLGRVNPSKLAIYSSEQRELFTAAQVLEIVEFGRKYESTSKSLLFNPLDLGFGVLWSVEGDGLVALRHQCPLIWKISNFPAAHFEFLANL